MLSTILNRKSINLDITHRCTLECPKCLRRSVATNNLGDLSLDSFKKIISHFEQIEFCGQISDPIFNPYFIDFIKIAKEKDKYLMVHTAASQKPVKWYNPRWVDYRFVSEKETNLKFLRDALCQAVKRQLMSDVPYGVLL